jgi:hypothetical protein
MGEVFIGCARLIGKNTLQDNILPTTYAKVFPNFSCLLLFMSFSQTSCCTDNLFCMRQDDVRQDTKNSFVKICQPLERLSDILPYKFSTYALLLH